MAIKINFDVIHNAEMPTFILAKRNGQKIGVLNAQDIEISDSLNDASEITFVVNKYADGKICKFWNDIVDFKLVYCVEWDKWFEITIEIDESTNIKKTVSCTNLGHAELSQIMLYNIEINTESDIAREDYKTPTVLYNPLDTSASLLHRITEKAQHYTIAHVDNAIQNIQRTFTFDDKSIYDAFQEIAEEIHCLFVLDSNSDSNGNIQRTISVYDLESNCLDCGYRGEFTSICPKCGSNNIDEGYGNDTGIFVTSDELADNIELTSDTDSIKNCFKLEAGDDLMTATIRNCNPNGSDYIWYISDSIKKDMSTELADKIKSYDESYNGYQNTYVIDIDQNLLEQYNALVDKYLAYDDSLEKISTPITGYPSLMNAYYNTIDFSGFLQHSLMPTAELNDTTAADELAKLGSFFVNFETNKKRTKSELNEAILAKAKNIVDVRYKVEIYEPDDIVINENGSNPYFYLWNGKLAVTNRYDETDTAKDKYRTGRSLWYNYSGFVKQKLDEILKKSNTDNLSFTGLFEKEYDDFVLELKKYSLDCLNSFHDSCQSCIDILIEQGVGNELTWSGKHPNLYDDLYTPCLNKMSAINAEIQTRQSEVNLIIGEYNEYNELITYGLQNYIEESKLQIQDALNFKNYLGDDLWLEFCSYRREDKFSNDNYISDGLNNAELFKRAYEFIEIAQKEIYKSAELQHSISTSLKNLLTIKKFEPLVNDFEVGNWLRIMVDDEIYKLRLIHYSINYNNLDNITVEFSDVTKINTSIKSVQDILAQATTMATSYSSVQRQAKQGEESKQFINNWSDKGLDITNNKIVNGSDNQTQTWDEHGMLFKKYDSVKNDFEDTQLKIINSTLAITNDNWQTVKTAVGAYYYFDSNGTIQKAYGVNAETIVGKLILGEQLGIYNESGSLTFNANGFKVSSNENGNSFRVNPNDSVLVAISNGTNDVFYIDDSGKLHIAADGKGIDVSANTDIVGMKSDIATNKGNITKNANNIATNTDNIAINTSDIATLKSSINNIDLSSEYTSNNVAIKTSIKEGKAIFYTDSNITGIIMGDKTTDSSMLKISSQIGGTALSANNKVYYILNNGVNPCDWTERHFFDESVRLNSYLSIPDYSQGGYIQFKASTTNTTYAEIRADIDESNNISEIDIDASSVVITGDFSCQGTKNRLVKTQNFGVRTLNAMESTMALFSDMGTAICDDTGKAIVFIDPIFYEAIDSCSEYQVFITQIGSKKIYYVEKDKDKFIIYGEPNAVSDWVMYAKQKDYTDLYIKESNEPSKPNIKIDESIFNDDDKSATISEDYMNEFKDTLDEQALEYLSNYEQEVGNDDN